MKQSWRENGSKGLEESFQFCKRFIQKGWRTAEGEEIRESIRSVGMKLFLLIFCSILACVLTLGWFSYSKSSSIIQQKVADSSSQTAMQTAGKISLMLEGYERQSLQFITDSKFTSMLGTLAVTKDDYEMFDTARQLTEKLNSVAMADSNYESISLIPLDEGGQFISTGSMLNQEEFADRSF